MAASNIPKVRTVCLSIHLSIYLSVCLSVGIRRCSDGTLHLYINGEDLVVGASNIPKVRTVCLSASIRLSIHLSDGMMRCDKYTSHAAFQQIGLIPTDA